MILLGKISGVFGVKGWVKIYSHTSPIQQIIRYSPLYLKSRHGWEPVEVENGQKQGKGVIAKLAGVNDRDAAFAMIGSELGIRREQLPELKNDSWYWSDLEGLRVVNTEGFELGYVAWLFSTGSNDVLVVEGDKEHMLPWLEPDVIQSVDMEKKELLVDWDPEF